MSSILTNSSAMVALQTLKSVNSNLQQTQSEISTGKSVASAKDNSAVWAISKVMESDVKGFKGIQESLSLGESTVAVARNASETVTDLLTDIKGKIVAAQEENVDREKIQTDIDALTDQIKTVVGAAQFNGLNLVQGTEDVNILSSLDRSGNGDVSAASITVARQDLSTETGQYGSTAVTGGDLTALGSVNGAASGTSGAQAGLNAQIQVTEGGGAGFADGDTFSLTVGGSSFTVSLAGTESATDVATLLQGEINARDIDGVTATLGANPGELVISNTNAFEDVDVSVSSSLTDTTGGAGANLEELNGATGLTQTSGTIAQRAEAIDFSAAANVAEGDGFEVTVAGAAFRYVAGAGETMEDVARGLKTAIDSNPPDGVTTKVQLDDATGAYSLAIDYDNASTTTIALAASTGGEASGGLFGLDSLDVTTNAGADSALDNIESLIQNSIDAAAEFGSAGGRIETQSEFVGKLVDSLKSGIGTLVDADLEETSARLQALQVQQQLATQSLSIANQAPQNILSLFR
ncbi:flagellin [Jannaschia sp. CCS1]|uniref:flagellin N-terminal helical domain-containing protein n=1 Tax=Jannaschia sp. (strain CCS1) TaxID=290400 RepID=UPI000053C7AB|nr:flagellin [Jannaschia sp. CCS1]ABD57120.1 flagellin protein [Jannaschia sp. CCS1]